MMFQSARALVKRQVAEWQTLVTESFTSSKAIEELIHVCRSRTWDKEIQDIVSRIRTPGQPPVFNPVQNQIREAFGNTEHCPEEFEP